MGQVLEEHWLRVIHPGVFNRLGHIRHVLFDFDGTLSVLRQGWEEVMIPLMIEAITEDRRALSSSANASVHGMAEIEREVRAYVDRSSGTLTIRQMQWLAEAVQRYGLAGEPRTARAYKALYLQRLMVQVGDRIARLASGESTPGENMVAGAEVFVRGLAQRGARLYLASGTDHTDVLREASALGLLPYFNGGVYGALDDSEDHAKEKVIQRIMDENGLAGEALLVVGDGPVEIRAGAARGALTLGVASDEAARSGWNPRKVERLAGADLIIADFREAEKLIQVICIQS
jgi:phosphoglycolate phosphatase-like HAD superfamily hydrolase